MDPTPEPYLAIHVVSPVTPAWRRMVRVCFAPFRIEKWFVLGFCAFLAHLGSGGISLNFPGGGPGGGGGGGVDSIESWFEDVLQWVADHLGLVVGIAAGIVIVTVGITALLFWLSSRGKFMLVHGIAHDRAAVVEPWKRYAEPANRLFVFRLMLFLLVFTVVVGTVGLSGYLAWPWFEVNDPSLPFLRAIVVILCVVTPLLLFYAHAEIIVNDFVVPRMMASEEGPLAAWGATFREVIWGRFWAFFLFYLFRSLLWMAEMSVMYLVFCLTCCIAVIPYLTQVILLPVFVFDWAYALYFVRQFGPGWNVFPFDPETPTCPRCNYDLRGSRGAESCPECGYALRWDLASDTNP